VLNTISWSFIMSKSTEEEAAQQPCICVSLEKSAPPEPPDSFGALLFNLAVAAISIAIFVTLMRDQDRRQQDYNSPPAYSPPTLNR
jgi:hypothetical protein